MGHDTGVWWKTADQVTPGPSPRYVCTRPRCGLVYRTLAFTHHDVPDCPMCGQPYVHAHGRRITRLLTLAAAAVSCVQEVNFLGSTLTSQADNSAPRRRMRRAA